MGEEQQQPSAASKRGVRVRAQSSAAPSFNACFFAHVERIKRAKAQADKLADETPLDAREASVALLWEFVFDTLCNSPELSVSDFNTVAGIIQKLASAKVSGSQTQRGGADCGLSEETLRRIESQLKLL